MKSIKFKLLAYAYSFLFFSCSGNDSSFTVREETINEAVYASGEIMPEPYRFIQSGMNEIINHICVEVGDCVKEGDIVAFLGSSEDDKLLSVLMQQLETVKDAGNSNSPVLNELRQKIDAARKKYDSDKKNAGRYTALAASHAVSQKEAEYYQLLAETSRIEFLKANDQYEARLNELSAERLEIENRMAQAANVREDKILRSNIDGKVLSIPKKEGEAVIPGDVIMLIGNDSCFRLNLIIDERDVHKVKPGQKVAFETDAYPNRLFNATLNTIDPLVNTELRSFRAEATIEAKTFFYPQSAVEANIIIREKQKALLIPSGYLFPGDSVLMRQGNEIRMQKVTTGIRTAGKVEITDGINTGDIIYNDRK